MIAHKLTLQIDDGFIVSKDLTPAQVADACAALERYYELSVFTQDRQALAWVFDLLRDLRRVWLETEKE